MKEDLRKHIGRKRGNDRFQTDRNVGKIKENLGRNRGQEFIKFSSLMFLLLISDQSSVFKFS